MNSVYVVGWLIENLICNHRVKGSNLLVPAITPLSKVLNLNSLDSCCVNEASCWLIQLPTRWGQKIFYYCHVWGTLVAFSFFHCMPSRHRQTACTQWTREVTLAPFSGWSHSFDSLGDPMAKTLASHISMFPRLELLHSIPTPAKDAIYLR